MAYSSQQWKEARYYFKHNKSLAYISEKTGISRGQISKKAKAQNWEKETEGNSTKEMVKRFEKKKETLEREKEEVVSKVATLDSYEITILDEIVEDEMKKKSTIFNTQLLAVVRNNEILTRNTKPILTKQKFFDEGKLVSEKEVVVEVPLNSDDVKSCIDGTDKASVTLGVNQRHANSQVVNNNTNAQQNNLPLRDIEEFYE